MGKLDIHMCKKKKKSHWYFPPDTITLKWIINLNIKAKTTELFKQSIEGNHFCNNLLNVTSKAQSTREKIGKLELIKI